MNWFVFRIAGALISFVWVSSYCVYVWPGYDKWYSFPVTLTLSVLAISLFAIKVKHSG